MTETIDLSDVVWLRRRLARGGLSARIGALRLAFSVALIVDGFSQAAFSATNPVVIIAVVVLVGWLGFRLANALQHGSRRAAWILMVVLVPYTGLYVFSFNYYSGLFNLVTGLPIYFIVMAAIGLLLPRARRARDVALSLHIDPHRSGIRHGRSRPAFSNKLSGGMYAFLVLTLIVALVPMLLSIADSARTAEGVARSSTDPASSTAVTFGSDVGRKLVGLWVAPKGPDADPARATGYVFGYMLLPVLLVSLLYRRARRHAVARATALMDFRPDAAPILYLRSFRDDRIKMRARAANGRGWLETILRVGFEEVAVDQLWRLSQVIAIGKPGEKFAPLGAARDWVPDDRWQSVVENVSRNAKLIVLVVGRSDGVRWELDRLLNAGYFGKVVLVVPPVSTRELEARWTFLIDRLAGRQSLELPSDVHVRQVRAIVFPGGGPARLLIVKDRDDWAYETVLDAAALSIVDTPPATEPTHVAEPAVATEPSAAT